MSTPIEFERFRVRNAFHFTSLDIPLRHQGLVRMMGDNGAGKSTVWHLFTQTAQGSTPNTAKKSDMTYSDPDKKKKADENFLLELTFKKNGQLYVAAQAINSKEDDPMGETYGTGVYLFRDGSNISMHKDPDTLKLIKETLGWSIEEWYGYVYLAQSTSHVLIKGTRSERQNYLSALFNLQPLDVLHKHFKAKAEAMQEKVDQIEYNKQELAIKSQLYSADDHAQYIKDYAGLIDRNTLLKAELQDAGKAQERYKLLQDRKDKLSKLTAESESTETLSQRIADVETHQAKVSSNQVLRTRYERSLAELVAVAKPSLPLDWKEEYATSPDLDVQRERAELQRLTQLESSLVEVPAVQIPTDVGETLNSPDINLAQVKRQISEMESRPAPSLFTRPTEAQLEGLREVRTESQIQISQLEADIKRLGFNEDVCDKCGTTLDCGDREAKLAQKKEALSEAEDSFEVAVAKLKEKERHAKAWADHDALGPDRSAELPELKASVALYEKKILYKKLLETKAQHDAFIKAKAETAVIPEIKERLNIYRLKQDFLKVGEQTALYNAYLKEKAQIESDLAKVEQIESRAGELITLKNRLKAAQDYLAAEKELAEYADAVDWTEEIARIGQELEAGNLNMGLLKSKIDAQDKIGKQVAELQASVSSQEKTVRLQKRYALLQKGYGKAGALREKQLSKYSRYLEEALMAHTSRQLPHHRFKISVDDGIDIMAEYIGPEKRNRNPYDVKFFSGAETNALSVAFLFALDDLQPPHRRSNLKIIDEVEAGFDKNRVQDFINHTLPQLRERAETVIVISHNHAAQSGAFDRVWEVSNGQVHDRTPDKREFA